MAGVDKRKRKKKKKRKRNMINDGVDRISELPVHLRELILDSLSMKEAVATSVLSSKWRYCWTGIRKLDFDYDFWFCGHSDLNCLELTIAVYRILMLHRGPIHKFKLYVPGMENKEKEVDINMWLRVLSNSGVHNIKINASDYFDSTFPIPSCLFDCRELEKLSLCSCKLGAIPSDLKCFANLTSLTLSGVAIDNRLLGRLIYGCSKLEKLSIEALINVNDLCLKALNLKKLYFNDVFLECIIFKDIPKLTCVSLLCDDRVNDASEWDDILDVLCSMSKIEELTFDFHLLESVYENYPSSTPVPLENLKSLTLRSVNLCLSGDVLFTLCFLRSTPNLQNLTINSCIDYYCCQFEINEEQRAADKLLESEAKKYTSYNSLETIKIRGRGSRHENLLIELLQTRCPKVKSFVTESSLLEK